MRFESTGIARRGTLPRYMLLPRWTEQCVTAVEGSDTRRVDGSIRRNVGPLLVSLPAPKNLALPPNGAVPVEADRAVRIASDRPSSDPRLLAKTPAK